MTRTIRASAAPTAPARCSPARMRGPGAGPASPRPSAGCTSNNAMDSHLRQLEDQSVYILREAYKHFDNLAMLWSMGKDSTALLWLVRKAFFGHVPFPLIHIDTSYKIPAMIEYRDRIAREWRPNLVIGQNKEALANGMNHTLGRVECCTALKTNGLKNLIAEKGYTGIILGVRADEEGTRAKELPVIDLYFDKGDGTRYRSLGCAPCTFPIKSTAKTVDAILEELRSTTVAERSGRAQDEGRGMELLRKDGYM